jgi:hypothetical protein
VWKARRFPRPKPASESYGYILTPQRIESSVFVGASLIGMVGHSCVWGRKVPKDSDSISNSAQAGDYSSSFSDVLFQNERAMWWQEFDSVGEKTVRDYVERNSYTPTGMVVARQWLARHDILQLRGDVQSIRALAEQAQGTASQLASRVDANGRAIAEIAATAKRNARTMVSLE